MGSTTFKDIHVNFMFLHINVWPCTTNVISTAFLKAQKVWFVFSKIASDLMIMLRSKILAKILWVISTHSTTVVYSNLKTMQKYVRFFSLTAAEDSNNKNYITCTICKDLVSLVDNAILGNSTIGQVSCKTWEITHNFPPYQRSVTNKRNQN